MFTGLVAFGFGLTWAWVETLYDWDHFTRRQKRSGWPRTELQWRLPLLFAATAVFAWAAWRYWSH